MQDLLRRYANLEPRPPQTMPPWLHDLLAFFSIPEVGLPALFIIALLSATLLPMGSEPALVGLLLLSPELFWPAIITATLGNTLGGSMSWLMGAGANYAYQSRLTKQATNQSNLCKTQHHHSEPIHRKAVQWLSRFGAKTCLLSWLPVIGDPLCALAGWLRLPFWPCVWYMLIGKFLRYWLLTLFWLYVLDK